MLFMSWINLLIAAIFEIGWPVGLKMAQTPTPEKFLWIIFAITTMTLSGVFLFLAQKEIPVGVAYAVWTGIGTIGTFYIGVMFFNDALTLIRTLGILLILSGVILLKIGH